MKRICLFVFLIWVFAPLNAAAQQINCSAALVQNAVKYSGDKVEQLAFLHLVNEDNYSEAKKDVSATVPGYFDGNYGDFAKSLQKYREQQGIALSTREIVDFTKYYLSSESLEAYKTCISVNA
ncbi:MAG: hypothetical protein AAGJ70_12095, partial [Pseudomonadota bacterium]